MILKIRTVNSFIDVSNGIHINPTVRDKRAWEIFVFFFFYVYTRNCFSSVYGIHDHDNVKKMVNLIRATGGVGTILGTRYKPCINNRYDCLCVSNFSYYEIFFYVNTDLDNRPVYI